MSDAPEASKNTEFVQTRSTNRTKRKYIALVMERSLLFNLLYFLITLEDLVTAADMLGAVIIEDDVISLTYESLTSSV